MKTLIAIVAFLMISTHVFAGAFSGTYKTMPSKKSGGWAYVKFGACKENKHLTCGTLIKAFSKDGKVIKNYEHKGKYVVCLLYTSPSPRDNTTSRMPSSA